jgi:hypothetical protein
MFRKLIPIKTPEIANVQFLCRDNVTSHGNDDSVDATEAPKPAKTSSEGSAQQSSVPTELNREK